MNRRLWYRIGAQRRMWWWRLKTFITGLLPTQCVRCGGWWLNRDTRDVRHTSGVWVPVCLSCYEELYGEE